MAHERVRQRVQPPRARAPRRATAEDARERGRGAPSPARVRSSSPGGTEVDNPRGQGHRPGPAERRPPRTRVVTSAIEHHAVLTRRGPRPLRRLRRPDGPQPQRCGHPGGLRAKTRRGTTPHSRERAAAPPPEGERAASHRGENETPVAVHHRTRRGAAGEGRGGLRDAREQRGGHRVAGTSRRWRRSPPSTACPCTRTPCRPRAPLDVWALGRAREPRGSQDRHAPGYRTALDRAGHPLRRRSAAAVTSGVAGPGPPPWRARWVPAVLERAEAGTCEEHARRTAAPRDRPIAGILDRVFLDAPLHGPGSQTSGGNRLATDASCFPGSTGRPCWWTLRTAGGVSGPRARRVPRNRRTRSPRKAFTVASTAVRQLRQGHHRAGGRHGDRRHGGRGRSTWGRG